MSCEIKLNSNLNIFGETTQLNNTQCTNIINNIINNLNEKLNNEQQIIIGIYLNKSPYLPLIIYAILLSNNIYLPLDTSYPINKIEFYITNSKCYYIITDTNNMNNINAKYSQVIDYNELINDNIKQKKIINNNCNNEYKYEKYNNQDLAYILYTSGSTGNPKGTMNKITSLINHMEFLINEFDFKQSDIFLFKTPICFDASTWEIYLPLFCKIQLCVSNDRDYKNPIDLANLIIKNNVNIIQIIPNISIYLCNEIKKLNPKYKLKYIFCGGEPLSKNVTIKLLDICDEVINLYGPSECCCNTVYFRINKNNLNKLLYTNNTELYCPIGKPITNVNTKIINNELYLSGEAVSIGYINNEEKTKEQFVEINDVIWYKTGDIVKYTYDDNLIFCERNDTQIKINGQRIEIDEIENVIRFHPYVLDCKICFDKQINKLICHICPDNIDTKIIRNICINNLEKIKIPAKFILHEKFPQLDNGKINMKVLQTYHNFNNHEKKNSTTKKDKITEDCKISTMLKDIINLSDEVLKTNDVFDNSNKYLLDVNVPINCIGFNSINTMILKNKLQNKYKVNIQFNNDTTLLNIKEQIMKYNLTDKEKKLNTLKIKNLMSNLENIFLMCNKIIAIHSSFINLYFDEIELNNFKKNIQQLFLKFIEQDYIFLFPRFNFSFCKYGYFHSNCSTSEVGILAEWILELNNTICTNHPIYNWVVLCKNINNNSNIKNMKKYLNNNTCFGINSIFDYLYNNNSSYVLFDCQHFTQIHYCEEIANVEWRYKKKFSGIIDIEQKNDDTQTKTVNVDMFCRKLDVKNNLGFEYFNHMQNNIYKTKLNNINIYYFNTKEICNILINKLKHKELLPIK